MAKVMSLEANVSKLQNGKQTAKPKRKAEKRGSRGVDLFYNGVYPTEFTSVTKPPSFSSSKDGCSVISGREIVGTLKSVFTDGVAPALSDERFLSFEVGTFKWLRQYANLYDLYRFRYVRLYFQPLLSTTFSGSFGAYFDPEPTDIVAPDFETLSQNFGAKTCSIHQTMALTVGYDKLNRLPWYTVTSPAGNGSPVGKFYWRSTSLNAVTPIAGPLDAGFVWIEYSAEFKNPTSLVSV